MHLQEDFSGNKDVQYSYNQNNPYPYESIIELPHVDFTFVGFYHCVKNSSEADGNLDTLVDNSLASSIYLFVEGMFTSYWKSNIFQFIQILWIIIWFIVVTDPNHPLVPVSLPILNGAQYQDIVIPCKPTSKMWDVQLIKEGDEVISNSVPKTFTFNTFKFSCRPKVWLTCVSTSPIG